MEIIDIPERTQAKSLKKNYFNAKVDGDWLLDYKHHIVENLRTWILNDQYPCIGAQTAVNAKTISFGFFNNMNAESTPENLCDGLYQYIEDMKERPGSFLTYIAVFEEDRFSNEENFENALWELLHRMHCVDKLQYDWNENVSNHTENSQFSFSIGGEAFFLVGMHPKSSRKARKFNYPAIAFNLHSQFEYLREKGRYDRIQKVVRQRELNYQGTINPMLADYGEGLEAPQYSGRKVGKNWKCPYAFNK